jgi:hypothetical protein
MNWYRFGQNNSGGVYTETDDLDAVVFVEAPSAREANTVAQTLGIYFNGCADGYDCDCCGDRWYSTNETWAESRAELLEEFGTSEHESYRFHPWGAPVLRSLISLLPDRAPHAELLSIFGQRAERLAVAARGQTRQVLYLIGDDE